MSLDLVGVLPDELHGIWEAVEPWVEMACARKFPKLSTRDIHEAVAERRMQLWLAMDEDVRAVCVTELVNHPLRRVCRIVMCTGEGRQDWQHYVRVIEAWALENGCESMELIARPGWKKILSDYEMTHVFLEKGLRNELVH